MSELHQDVLDHRDWLLSWIEVQPGGTVLDLGCGGGEDLRQLAQREAGTALTLIGLDASEPVLATARASGVADPRLSFQRHHLGEPLPVPGGVVDVVYSNNLLECLANPEALVREVARVLAPNGQVVVGHWDWDTQVYDGADRERVRRLVHAYADWQQAWMEHSDGWMGRRLWGLFQASEALSGTVHARVLINTEYAAPWFGFANAQALRGLAGRGFASSQDVERFHQEQQALQERGSYFYSITGYAFVGRRAAARPG